MAPEIFFSINYNEKCDIYSLGILIYEMLTQKSLFLGMNKQDIISKNYLGIFEVKKLYELSQEFYDLLEEMLQKDPNLRISAQKAKLSPLFAKYLNTSCLTEETQINLSAGQKQV